MTHFSAQDLNAALDRLAKAMKGTQPLLLIPIMVGAIPFVADLLDRLPAETVVRPIAVTRGPAGASVAYLDRPSTFEWQWHDPWIVDDGMWTGGSLKAAYEALAADMETHRIYVPIRSVVMVRRACGATVFEPDLVGFESADSTVHGYGSDSYLGRSRGLREVVSG